MGGAEAPGGGVALMNFQIPTFTFWNVAFTAIGVAIFWGKWGRTKLKAYVLSDIVNLLPVDDKWRSAIEFVVFVAFGCLVGIGVTQPTTAAQALTAGLGWTGFVTRPVSRS
jgi:hypothetical protein